MIGLNGYTRRYACSLAVLPLTLLAAATASAVTVRVQETSGGPRSTWMANRSLRGSFGLRMNSGYISADAQWASRSFEFVPDKVDGTGTLHFRFAQVPGDVWLADVRIQDVKTGNDILPPGSFATEESFRKNWSSWPDGSANTVGTIKMETGSIHVSLKNPPGGNWPDFHLHSMASLRFAAGHTYRCRSAPRPRPR